MRMLKSRGAIFMPGCCTFGSITFIIFMEYIYIYVCILYIESSLIKRVINRIFLEIIIFMAVYTYTYVNLLGTYITRHLIFSCLGRQSFRSWVGHGCAVLVEDMFHV